MIVNVVLPFLSAYAGARESERLHKASLRMFRAHPKLGDNETTREMMRLLGAKAVLGAVDGARQQQGLMHLYRSVAVGAQTSSDDARPTRKVVRERSGGPWDGLPVIQGRRVAGRPISFTVGASPAVV